MEDHRRGRGYGLEAYGVLIPDEIGCFNVDEAGELHKEPYRAVDRGWMKYSGEQIYWSD